MIKIDPQPQNTRKWKLWRTHCSKAAGECEEAVARGDKPTFSPKLYARKSMREEYFFSKGPPFYGRCVYCEREIADASEGDVDHFRPKGSITDEEDNPVLLLDENGAPVLDENGNPKPRPGYYWLAYDWRNLVPSCKRCNQPRTVGEESIGKRSRFPVAAGTRHAETPEEVAEERPLLINPASGDDEDDPAKHLRFDTDTGLIGWRTERGEMCVKIFGLNVRQELLDGRKNTVSDAENLFARIIHHRRDPERLRETLARLRAMREGRSPHAMAGCAVIRELEPLFGWLFDRPRTGEVPDQAGNSGSAGP
jgi:hypothetical protein